MSAKPKYIEVLKYLFTKQPRSIHYIELAPIIYSKEIIEKYRHHRSKRSVIDGMVCKYMGRLARKDYCEAEYKHNRGYSYFIGYYIRPKGIELLKKLTCKDKT